MVAHVRHLLNKEVFLLVQASPLQYPTVGTRLNSINIFSDPSFTVVIIILSHFGNN